MAQKETQSRELILRRQPEKKTKTAGGKPVALINRLPPRPVTQDGDWIVEALTESMDKKLDNIVQIRLESKKGRARTAATLILQPEDEGKQWRKFTRRDLVMIAFGAYVITCLPVIITALVTAGQ